MAQFSLLPGKNMQEKPVRPIVSGGSPRRIRMPLHRAQRWLAEGEDGHRPLVRVFVTQTAFKAINNHAASDMDNEVGGWLAGRWCKDIDTKDEFIVVEALLPAQQVRSGSAFLTFTHDSQVAMLAALEERYAKKGIVGWYHTHPRMGLFLSGYDTWLHNHFFPHPWQVALVVEPHSHIGGFFIRDRSYELGNRRYHGFYELHNRKHESIVDWQNLRLEKKPEERKAVPTGSSTSKGSRKMGEGKPSLEKTSKLSKAEPPGSKPSVPEVGVDPAKPEREEDWAGKELPPTIEAKPGLDKEERREKPLPEPLFRKFEGPAPPAKVSLLSKEDKKKSDSKTNPPEEAKP